MKYKALLDIRGAFNMVMIKKNDEFETLRLEYHEGIAYLWTSINDGQGNHAMLSLDVLTNNHIIKVNYE